MEPQQIMGLVALVAAIPTAYYTIHETRKFHRKLQDLHERVRVYGLTHVQGKEDTPTAAYTPIEPRNYTINSRK